MFVLQRVGILCASLALVACAAPSPPYSAVPHTAVAFKDAVRVVDDPMSSAVVLRSPKMGTHTAQGVYSHTIELAASLDRKTGAAMVLVSHHADHRTGAWIFFRSATYLDENGEPQTARHYERARGDVAGCSRYGCEYGEGGSFAIGETELRRIVSSQARRDASGSWRLRFNGDRSYLDGDVDLQRLEGFLAALEAERARRGFAVSMPAR